LGREPDPWAAFRAIEVLELTWSQSYRHSLGKTSRFFLELENKRLLATRCPQCGMVWLPPRPVCPNELAITDWVDLNGRGTLVSWSILHSAAVMAPFLTPPYALAYMKLEGADTLFAHVLRNFGEATALYHGLPVKAVFDDGPVAHPIHLLAFEPAQATNEG
jgi:uncharacterized OB-fold protein